MISLDVKVAQCGTSLSSCSPVSLPRIYQNTTSIPSHSLLLLWPQVASFLGNQGIFAHNSCVFLPLFGIFLVSFPPASSFKGEHDFYLHVVLLFSFNHLLKRPPTWSRLLLKDMNSLIKFPGISETLVKLIPSTDI